MRAIVTIPMIVPFWVILGCEAAEPEPPLDDAAEEQVEEVDQALCADCNCPRGTRCYVDGTCQGYPVFGPIPNLGPPCIGDCQCPAGTRCEMDIGSPSSYGYCVTPTCSVSFDAVTVPPNGTTIFTVTSQWMPQGSYSLLYGTKDGVWDENGSVYNLTSGAFPIVNSPGLAGDYMRYVVMKGPQHEVLCQTAPAYAYFQP